MKKINPLYLDMKYAILVKEGTIIKLGEIPFRITEDTWFVGNNKPQYFGEEGKDYEVETLNTF